MNEKPSKNAKGMIGIKANGARFLYLFIEILVPKIIYLSISTFYIHYTYTRILILDGSSD